MDIAAFLTKYFEPTGEFKDLPDENITAQKLRTFVKEIAETLGEDNVIAGNFVAYYKRIGYTNQRGEFSGVVIDYTPLTGTQIGSTFISFVAESRLILSIELDQSNYCRINSNSSFRLPFWQISDNELIEKRHLGETIYLFDGLGLPDNYISQRKRFKIEDIAIPSTGNIGFSYDYFGKSNYIGDKFEIFFRAKSNATVSFTTSNPDFTTSNSTPLPVLANKYYLYEVYMMPISTTIIVPTTKISEVFI